MTVPAKVPQTCPIPFNNRGDTPLGPSLFSTCFHQPADAATSIPDTSRRHPIVVFSRPRRLSVHPTFLSKDNPERMKRSPRPMDCHVFTGLCAVVLPVTAERYAEKLSTPCAIGIGCYSVLSSKLFRAVCADRGMWWPASVRLQKWRRKSEQSRGAACRPPTDAPESGRGTERHLAVQQLRYESCQCLLPTLSPLGQVEGQQDNGHLVGVMPAAR